MKKQYLKINIFSHALMIMISICTIAQCSETGITLAHLQEEKDRIDQSINQQMSFFSTLWRLQALNDGGLPQSVYTSTQSDLKKFDERYDKFIKNILSQADREQAIAMKKSLHELHSPENIEKRYLKSCLINGGLIIGVQIAAGAFLANKILGYIFG